MSERRSVALPFGPFVTVASFCEGADLPPPALNARGIVSAGIAALEPAIVERRYVLLIVVHGGEAHGRYELRVRFRAAGVPGGGLATKPYPLVLDAEHRTWHLRQPIPPGSLRFGVNWAEVALDSRIVTAVPLEILPMSPPTTPS